METEIRLVYKDTKEAKAVSEAISPDNVETPGDLSIQTSWTEKTVTTTVKYDEDNIMTFISTIDDILSCASVAEKAFMATKMVKRISQ
jgi:hypothetical protein